MVNLQTTHSGQLKAKLALRINAGLSLKMTLPHIMISSLRQQEPMMAGSSRRRSQATQAMMAGEGDRSRWAAMHHGS